MSCSYLLKTAIFLLLASVQICLAQYQHDSGNSSGSENGTNNNIENLLTRICNPQKSSKFSLQRLYSSSAAANSNSDSTILFESLNQVRQLIQSYKSNQQLCPTNYHDSIVNLEPLLESSIVEDICSPRAYDLILAYHLDFIHYFEPEIAQDELKFKRKLPPHRREGSNKPKRIVTALKPIPEALRRFFILFAKQIDGICTMHIAERLNVLVDEQIESELKQFSLVERQIRKQLGQRALSEGSNTKSAGKLSLKELKLIDFSSNRLFLNVAQDNPIRRLRELCVLHFTPIYMEVFEVVLRLNNLGYRDQIISTSIVDNEFRGDRTITRWYDIIQVCELVKDMEIVDSKSELAKKHKQQPIWFDDSNNNNGNGLSAAVAAMKSFRAISFKPPPHTEEEYQKGMDKLEEMQLVVPHEPISFGESLIVDRMKLAKRELANFDSFVKWSVRDRTNQVMIARRDLKSFIGRQFERIRMKSVELKERLTQFVHNHGISLLAGSAVVNLVLLIALIALVPAIG